jgi:hypothetical protein
LLDRTKFLQKLHTFSFILGGKLNNDVWMVVSCMLFSILALSMHVQCYNKKFEFKFDYKTESINVIYYLRLSTG